LGIAVTIRWFLDDEVFKKKHPIFPLPYGKGMPMPWCSQCNKTPPEVFQFIVLGQKAYCHGCIRQSLDDVEETDSRAKESP
jgi:hypothetical protein